MATIKAYTDIEQSRKLAEILPLESADMHYNDWTYDFYDGYEHTGIYLVDLGIPQTICGELDIPCWSLAALLGVLPKIGSEEPMIQKLYYANNPTERYICQYSLTNITGEYDNPVDTCYEMILKLNKLNML